MLGSGTFADVYQASHIETGKKVAVKILPKVPRSAAVNPVKAMKMIENEVICMRRLGSSLNAVRLEGAYENNQNIQLVLELCEGGPLLSRLTPSPGADYGEEDARRLIRAILRFVAQCHAKGFAYRDVKPENFLFLNANPASPLKATDFGLSVPCKATTRLSERCGTPHYMAPEVLAQDYDRSCDVWSAGVVAWQLLTGELPFQSQVPAGVPMYDQEKLFEAITSQEIDFETDAMLQISEPGRELVKAMLSRDPSQRPTAAEALQHQWFMLAGSSMQEVTMNRLHSVRNPLSTSVVQRLQRFHNYSRFKRVALERVIKFMSEDPRRPHIMKEIEALFKDFGARPDEEFELTYEEISSGLRDNGFQVEDAELSKLGIVPGRQITFAEFAASLIDIQKAEEHAEWTQWLEQAFESFDVYGSGVINPTEVVFEASDLGSNRNRFTSFELPPQDSQSHSELLSVLRDGRAAGGEGYIDLNEFLVVMGARRGDTLELYDRRHVAWDDKREEEGDCQWDECSLDVTVEELESRPEAY